MRLRVFLTPLFFVSLSPALVQATLSSLGKAAISVLALSSGWAPVGGQDNFLHTVGTSENELSVRLASIPGGYRSVGSLQFGSEVICADFAHNGTLRSFNLFDLSSSVNVYDSATTPNGTYIAGEIFPLAYAAFTTQECDDMIWGFEFTTPGDSRSFTAVAATPDGSAIFVGPSSGGGDSALFLVKMSPTGEKEWDREIVFPTFLDHSMGIDIYNDTLYIAGTTSTFHLGTFRGIFLMALTEAGDVQYIKIYALQFISSITDLKVTDDGYAMITGESYENPGTPTLFYAKLNTVDGTPVYFHQASFPSGMGTSSMGTSIFLRQGGGMVISGHYSVIGDSPIALQVDNDGIIEKSYFLRNLYNFSSGRATGAVQEWDGALIIGGHSDGFTDSSDSDLFIAKLGNFDGLGCGSNLTVQAVNLTDQVTVHALNVTVSPPSTTVAPTKSPSSAPITFTQSPSTSLSQSPSLTPSLSPSLLTGSPSENTGASSLAPTNYPTLSPTFVASYFNVSHTFLSANISTYEICALTPSPTFSPTQLTESPTNYPSIPPTLEPTSSPTKDPSEAPSMQPLLSPTLGPTSFPTKGPSAFPSLNPSLSPTQDPSLIPTDTPTLAPTLYPVQTAPPDFLYTIYNQTAFVGELYSFALVLSRYLVYDGALERLTLRAEKVSLQNKNTDWLLFNDTTHLFEGTPEEEDKVFVLLNVTDAHGMNTNSSFYISVRSLSSRKDSILDFFKDNVATIGASTGGAVGLLCIIIAIAPYFSCLDGVVRGCACFYYKKNIRERRQLDKKEKEKIEEERELVTQREKTAKEIRDSINALKELSQAKTEMQPINTLYMRKSPDTIII